MAKIMVRTIPIGSIAKFTSLPPPPPPPPPRLVPFAIFILEFRPSYLPDNQEGNKEGPTYVGGMGHKIEAGCGIREISRAGYGMKIACPIGMRSFQLVGCGIVLKLLAGCRISTSSDLLKV